MKDPSKLELDRLDLAILRALQDDGRLTNAELANRINASPATCHRRTHRLIEQGVIDGIHAHIAPDAVGLGALVMVGAVLDRSTPESFAAFEEAAMKMDAVLECNCVAGEFDYLLKIRVGDTEDFNRLHIDQLIALPAVRQVRSFFVIKEVKDKRTLLFRSTCLWMELSKDR